MFCKHCGYEIPDGFEFCGKCGKPLASAEETAVFVEIDEATAPDTAPAADIAAEAAAEAAKAAEETAKVIAASAPPQKKKKKTGTKIFAGCVSIILIGALLLGLIVAGIFLVPVIYQRITADGGLNYDPSNNGKLSRSNPYYDCYCSTEDYLLPDSDSTYICFAQIASFTPEQLYIAQQELYARHGEAFADPQVQAYFDARDWYTASGGSAVLNGYEAANLQLLQVRMSMLDGSIYHSNNRYMPYFSDPASYAAPDSQHRHLTAGDLSDLSKYELVIARNEIFARHGYIFKDPELQTYFYTKQWYVPTTPAAEFSDDVLSDIENSNVKMILVYERRIEGVTFSADNPYKQFYNPSQPYLYPYSNTQQVDTWSDFSLTQDKCVLARNEIFARHGYTFTNEDLLEYFLQQDWYQPTLPPGDLSMVKLSSVEQKNVDHFLALEKICDSIPTSLNRSLTYKITTSMFTVSAPAYWKNTTTVNVNGASVSIYEKYSRQLQSSRGDLMRLIVVSESEYYNYISSGMYKAKGVLVDSIGTRWYVLVYYPTDVRWHPLTRDLYRNQYNDSFNLTITPADGYTYIPY